MNTESWMHAAGVGVAAEYTEQAQVTDGPVRAVLVLVMLGLIALALWGMRRGWLARSRRQSDLPDPAAEPGPDWLLGDPTAGLFVGTGVNGDWMNRIVVFDLGVRSRCELAWGPDGVYFDREGARGLAIPAGDIRGVRVDRGVAGTVRARDSVVVITWRLGDRTLDTGFRADESPDHATVLDGLMATFSTGAR